MADFLTIACPRELKATIVMSSKQYKLRNATLCRLILFSSSSLLLPPKSSYSHQCSVPKHLQSQLFYCSEGQVTPWWCYKTGVTHCVSLPSRTQTLVLWPTHLWRCSQWLPARGTDSGSSIHLAQCVRPSSVWKITCWLSSQRTESLSSLWM
jgi:hypothetical protein